MWNGRWSRELDNLSGLYYDLFGEEPDCQDTDFDLISYQEYRNALVRSITTGMPVEFRRS